MNPQDTSVANDNTKMPYFAYGSNLDPEQLKERIRRTPEAKRARLLGYRLSFNKKASGGFAYANIVPDPNHKVWGVVYWCTPEEMKELDRYEGVDARQYRRAQVQVELDSGEKIEAIAYEASPESTCQEGRPAEKYLRHIIDGGLHHELPEAYLKHIKSIASQGNHLP